MQVTEGLALSVGAQLRNLPKRVGQLVGTRTLGSTMLRLPEARMGRQSQISIRPWDKRVLRLEDPRARPEPSAREHPSEAARMGRPPLPSPGLCQP